jgi:hypothetical protein
MPVTHTFVRYGELVICLGANRLFRKTRIRLVAMNAIVFILIFYLCVNMLFYYAKFQMYNIIDRRLQDIGKSIKSEKLNSFLANWDENRRGDELVFYLLTDVQGKGYQIPPSSIPNKFVSSVIDRIFIYYRVHTNDYDRQPGKPCDQYPCNDVYG